MFVLPFALRAAWEWLGLPIQPSQRLLSWPIPLWLDAILMVTLFPLVEEFVFRGLLISWLRRFGFVAAAAISTALFAAIHLPVTVHGWLYFAMIGALLCVVRYRTGSVWWCVAAHATYNAVPAAFILIFVIKW